MLNQIDFLQPILNFAFLNTTCIDISLFFYFPHAAFSIPTCYVRNEMSSQIRFYFPANYIKVINQFTASSLPHLGPFLHCLEAWLLCSKWLTDFLLLGVSFAWICARFSPSLKLNIWLPSSYLKKGKVSSLGEKFPAPNYENLIQNRLLREDNLRRRECEDHFLDSFVTQAEIEGFVVALDGDLQRTYGRLQQLSGVVFPRMKPRKVS